MGLTSFSVSEAKQCPTFPLGPILMNLIATEFSLIVNLIFPCLNLIPLLLLMLPLARLNNSVSVIRYNYRCIN